MFKDKLFVTALVIIMAVILTLCALCGKSEAQNNDEFQVEGWSSFGNGISPTIYISGTVVTYKPAIWLVLDFPQGKDFVVSMISSQGRSTVPVSASFDGGVTEIRYPYDSLSFNWNSKYCFQVFGGSDSYEPDLNKLLGRVCTITPDNPERVFLPLVATSR